MQSMGRRMARCLIEKAGAACFWGEQHQPPQELLTRAREYVGIVANGMGAELQGPDRVLELLQGETIALLLKNIGNTLAREASADVSSSASGAAAAAAAAASSRGDSWGSGCWALQAALQKLCEDRDLAAIPLPGLNHNASFFLGPDVSGVAVSAAHKMQCLRALVVLMHLLGEHLGSHALQVSANRCLGTCCLLKSTRYVCDWLQLLVAHSSDVVGVCQHIITGSDVFRALQPSSGQHMPGHVLYVCQPPYLGSASLRQPHAWYTCKPVHSYV
jgi:hypothetical protein